MLGQHLGEDTDSTEEKQDDEAVLVLKNFSVRAPQLPLVLQAIIVLPLT